jgi:recombinational DNA repair protein RecT
MAKKTVIRRMAKRLPSSADLDQVIANDNEASGFVQQPARAPIDITPAPDSPEGANRPSRLKKAIGGDSVDQATGEIIDAPAAVTEGSSNEHMAND